MVIAIVVDALYLTIIATQGEVGHVGRVGFIAAAIASAAACALVGATRPDPADRLPFLGAATGALLGLGYLGLFSIGLPLLIAGILCAAAWGATLSAAHKGGRRQRWLAVGLAITAPLLLVVGIALT